MNLFFFKPWLIKIIRSRRGRREPGNITLQRGRIFKLVLFKKKVRDQEVGPADQIQSGAGLSRREIAGPVQINWTGPGSVKIV